jgi:putative component of membrane protein insertase Oxa1/YidC/SpoIIIJ protein YidD
MNQRVLNIQNKLLKNMVQLNGTFLGIKRILKCNPFSKGGYDPLK